MSSANTPWVLVPAGRRRTGQQRLGERLARADGQVADQQPDRAGVPEAVGRPNFALDMTDEEREIMTFAEGGSRPVHVIVGPSQAKQDHVF
jgi:hypothetical protein